MIGSRKKGHAIQKAWKREAREARELRRRRIFLLSLQTVPVEKLEDVFRGIRDGKYRLVGLAEEPEQYPAIRGLREELWQ